MTTIQDLETYLKENSYKIEVFRSAAFYNEEVQEKSYYGYGKLKELIAYSSPFYNKNVTQEFSIETNIKPIGEEDEIQDMLEFRFVDFDNKRINNTEYGDDLLTEVMGSLCFQGYKCDVVYPDVEIEFVKFIDGIGNEFHAFRNIKDNTLLTRGNNSDWHSSKNEKDIPTNTKISLEIAFQYWKHTYTSNSINNVLQELKTDLESKGLQAVDDKHILSLFTEKLKHLTK